MEVAADAWDALLDRLGLADVYCSRGYLAASAVLAGGEPVLLHHADRGGDVVFACLVRSDPVDVVGPYGYGGPVAVGTAPPVEGFGATYAQWCAARGAVSTFCTYHPLLGNQALAARTGLRASPLAGTVAWPLAADDLVAGMHRHHRRLVRRALAEGLTATATVAPAKLDGFVALYEATMRRAGAAPFYLFPAAYWEALAAGVRLVRVDVRGGGEMLASVLGMGAPPWLHYHLGASADAGRRIGASQLALHGLARWGQEHGYELLHLGGGVGGRADSLLEYKLRFAPDGLVACAVGKAVHDGAAYARLSGTLEVDWDGFFPAYRAPTARA